MLIILATLILIVGFLIGYLVLSRKEARDLREQALRQDSDRTAMRADMEQMFANIANRGLVEQGKVLSDQQRTVLDEVLKPFKERVKEFEEKVISQQREALIQHTSLLEQIKHLTQLNTQVSTEASNLTKALKGDSKQQGAWGEMVLERVLEASGLTQPDNYEVQVSTSNEDGTTIRPDVVVHLPQDRHVIIDSKVSLTAYEEFTNAEEGSVERASALKRHLASVNNHIKQLSDKKYETAKGIVVTDFVMMFIPVESVFAISLREDQDLFTTAWSRKIVIVSPSTLLATLRTINSMWKMELQSRNAIEIARQAGDLYDKFVGFVDDLQKVGEQLEKAQSTHAQAVKKLSTGSGNIIGRIQKLQKLGVKASKQLPDDITTDD